MYMRLDFTEEEYTQQFGVPVHGDSSEQMRGGIRSTDRRHASVELEVLRGAQRSCYHRRTSVTVSNMLPPK
ncbi:MAG: hypothetical protein JWN85_691 [Gammaproteobacteria bacterium]|nr:hypothetical protein [Gammaproteobacteria bacterium]